MAFSGLGSGIQGDPYQITTFNQFKEIQNDLDKHFLMMNDINAGGLAMSQNYARFTGVLDGGNFTLSNYGTAFSNVYLLLPSGATIKNLVIENYSETYNQPIFSYQSPSSNYHKVFNTTFENIKIIGNQKFAYYMEYCTLNNVYHFRKDFNEPTTTNNWYIFQIKETTFNDCFFYFINRYKGSNSLNFSFLGTNYGLNNQWNRCSFYFDYKLNLSVTPGYGQLTPLCGGKVYGEFNQCYIGGQLIIDGSGQTTANSTRVAGMSNDGDPGSGLGIFTDCHIDFDILTTWNTPQTALNHFLIDKYGTQTCCFVQSRVTGFTMSAVDNSINTDVYAISENIIDGVTDIQAGVTLLTEAQSQDTGNFSNFDFVDTWEAAPDGSPKLKTALYDFTGIIPTVLESIDSEFISTAQHNITANLFQGLPPGATLKCYVSKTLEGIENPANEFAFTKVDDYTYTAQTLPDDGQNFVLVVYENGQERQTESTTITHYTVEQKTLTTIDAGTNYKTLNDTGNLVDYIHGLTLHNGYLYGSSRSSAGTDQKSIVKINTTDYSDVSYVRVCRNKSGDSFPLQRLEHIVYCSGFLWAECILNFTQSFLVRIDPATSDYMVFWSPEYSNYGQPIGTDGTYIYYTGDEKIYKLDTSVLIGSFASYGYTGTAAVNLPGNAVLGSCDIIQKHETELSYSHSIVIDDQYIYLALTTVDVSNTNGLVDGTGQNLCHFQKIDKSTMETAGDIEIPKCTDDMVQSSEYVFLAPEMATTDVELFGGNWGLLAVNKRTLEIKYLKALHSSFDTDNESDRAAFGVHYCDGKLIVQLSNTPVAFVINTSEIESWGENFPVGGATDLYFQVYQDGNPTSGSPNEFLVDNNDMLHVTTWETPATFLKFDFTGTGLTLVKEPIIQTSLVDSDSNSATVNGMIIDEGLSAMTAVGFKYGTDPGNLSNDVPATLGTEFQEVLSGLTPDIYYIKAYGTNTEGTHYGNIVVFSTFNVLTFAYNNATALLAWLNENSGCSVRCVQDAPGVADGETGTATDQDGNQYNTIVINEKRWFVENLKVTTYRNGDTIPEVTDATEWQNTTDGARCKYLG